MQPVLGGRELRATDVRRPVNNLALQIAEVDDVVIDEADGADACGGKIHGGGRAESAGADAQDLPCLEAALPVDADFRHDQMPAVAFDLVVRELRKRFSSGCHSLHCKKPSSPQNSQRTQRKFWL